MIQILLLCFSLLSLSAFAQADSNYLKQNNDLVYSTNNSTSVSEKMLVYQVLRLTNQNNEKSLMVVFCETSITNSKQRAKMKSDYMLRRERIYLSNVFFATVQVVEEKKITTDIKTHLRILEMKYEDIRVWTVLHSDLFLR